MLAKAKARIALLASLVSITLLIASGCSAQQAPSSQAPDNSSSPSAISVSSFDKDAEYAKALSGEGLVTGFIGEQFYDKPVVSEDDAIAAAESALGRVGGDETTKLELLEIRPTETGTTYYTFRQQAGDVVVQGAAVKLVVGKDGKVEGLVSSILPNVQLESLEAWEITQE